MPKRSYLLKGTIVEIKSKRGIFKGEVISANNWSIGNQPDDWYIELRDQDRGYVYWKQIPDGGGEMTVVEEMDNGR